MNKPALAAQIRAKKVGILIKDARLTTGKSESECATAMGVSPEQLHTYESGSEAPSLPELELLAYTLALPVEHFWGSTILAGSPDAPRRLDTRRIVELRRKMIGVMLRQARQDSGLTLPALADKAAIPPAELELFESGEKAVPFPVLELLLNALNKPVKEFQDRQGAVGQWYQQQIAQQAFKDMSPELAAFVAKPINRPYLEMAQRLSEMSVEKLRGLAETLLEITL